jgi:hypothetical protein
MENTPNDLFNIQLNQEASTSIQKTYTVARWLLGIGLFAVAVNIGFLILDYFVTEQLYKDDGWATKVRRYIVPALSIAGLATFVMQLFLYFNFFRKVRRAILINDSDIFNQSFHLFYKNSLYALVQFVISVLVNIYYFYSYYHILDRMPA